jgi:hypothetical protein
MRKWCDAAGLKDCSAHGLRKAVLASRLRTAHMATLYTKKARQKRIAGDAMGLLVRKEREEQ